MGSFVQRETAFSYDGKNIFGVMYLPESREFLVDGKYPTVVIAHGLGLTHRSVREYAEPLAEAGFLVVSFDFYGASPHSRSGGSTTEVSVETFRQDLNAVVTAVRDMDCVDASRLFLMGQSLGGSAAALVAQEHPEWFRGLVLFFPGFSIADEYRFLFGDKDGIPDTFLRFGVLTVGRKLAEDAMDADFSGVGAFTGSVLILHGDADERVPLRYSRMAVAEWYPHARLEVIPDAGHRFQGEAYDVALAKTKEFLRTALL